MHVRAVFVPLLAMGLLATVAGAACGDDDDGDDDAATVPAGADGEDVRVAVSDNKFEPNNVTVKANFDVMFEWSGSNPHSVVGTYAGEEIESPRLTGTGTFVFSSDTPGTFEYQCGVHGASMSGKITVQ